MAPPLPPNPSLVGIALVINTRAGPRFVFHYPARPRDDLPPTHSIWNGYGDSLADSDSASDAGYFSSDEEGMPLVSNYSPYSSADPMSIGDSIREVDRSQTRRFHSGGPDDEDDSSDDENRTQPVGAAWDTVCGFPTSALEKILSPPKSFHKKKFELGLEPLTYLGCPIFVREDGYWRKKREKKNKGDDITKFSENDGLDASSHEPGDKAAPESEHDVDNVNGEMTTSRPGEVEDDRTNRQATSVDGQEEDGDTKSTASDDDRRIMSMFNVVFIMNPPLLEHNLRIKEMFEFVIRKWAKALKYEQARSNWVWRQSEMILNMKERAREESESEELQPLSHSRSSIMHMAE